jgi:formylglycine-generating enzyme required for sulfatase activity
VVTVDAGGRESRRYQKQVQYFPEDLGNGVFLEMVSIPGGTFLMGSDYHDERPQHMVTLKPFYLGKFPVTQQQWQAVATLPQVRHPLNYDPSYFKGDNLPVEQVSWYEAVEFCERLSKKTGRTYRLPSEAQWEYACRAGTTTLFHFGEAVTPDLANYNGSYIYSKEKASQVISRQEISPKETTSVGSFQVANAFGLYDMHGNVWEWCADNWHGDYWGAPSDERAWVNPHSNLRHLRGGSCLSAPCYCRSASRAYNAATYSVNHLGFRVVCTAANTL